MSISLVASTSAESPDGNGFTTSAIDTTGATLLVVAVPDEFVGSVTLTDSKGNSWSTFDDGQEVTTRIFYAVNPTVGTGHTFTIGPSSSFSACVVGAFSSVKTTSPFDQSNTARNTSPSTTIQPGSITPSEDNELIVSAIHWNSTATVSINESMTIIAQTTFNGSAHWPVALAWKQQSTAAAINPTWTLSSSTESYALIASFKEQPAAPAGNPFVTTLGGRMRPWR